MGTQDELYLKQIGGPAQGERVPRGNTKAKKGKTQKPKQKQMAGSAYVAIAAVFFLSFVACLCWSAVALVSGDGVVVAVACMCASLVSSFGMLLCYLGLGPRLVAPSPRTVEVAEAPKSRLRHASVLEDSSVALAVGSSPVSASPKLWVFEPLP
jgi:hypothetical protein